MFSLVNIVYLFIPVQKWLDTAAEWLESIGFSHEMSLITVDAYVVSIVVLVFMLVEWVIRRVAKKRNNNNQQ